MAETTVPFDPLVFDTAVFDAADTIPELLDVLVTPRRVRAGQAVVIDIRLVNRTTSFGRTYPLTLVTPPSVTLYSPDNAELLSATVMSTLSDGAYRYRYQTSGAAVRGAYSAVFTAANGSMAMQSSKHVVYVVIP